MASEKQISRGMIQTKVGARLWSRNRTIFDSNRLEIFAHGDTPENESELGEPEIGTFTLPRTARPSLYKVILLNDDFTPMEFVISILKKFFNKSDEEAQRTMLQVHQDGAAIAGVYTFEVAETKVYLVNEFSRRHKYPLKCIMEKEAADRENT